MPVADELTAPIIHSDDEDHARTRRSFADDELDQQLTGCGASACCNPTSSCHRFIALILMCLIGFGEIRRFYILSSKIYHFFISFQVHISVTIIPGLFKIISQMKLSPISRRLSLLGYIRFIHGRMLYFVSLAAFYSIGLFSCFLARACNELAFMYFCCFSVCLAFELGQLFICLF